MSKISPQLQFIMNLAKVQTVLTRRFDSGLNGISLNELIILFHLSEAEDQKMRRIDLAEKVGLTASGITRLLLPMEKIGLIKRETDERDARVSYVMIDRGGKTKLQESLERAEVLSEDLLPQNKTKKIEELSEFLGDMGKTIIY